MDDGYYHGINKLKKPATKVMAPPGGQTHINVFSTPEPEGQKPINKCQEARSKSSVFAGPEEMNPSREVSPPVRQTNTSTSDDKAGQHTSTKVLAPPGGKSNFSIFDAPQEQAKPQAAQPKKQAAPSSTQNIFGGSAADQPKKQAPASTSQNVFGGGSSEVIGQRARNRQPPGGASHNIFG
ncbi:uncharacterized protein LOC135686132 [Rhopilema esculentum]|uniref:uncharacterized protein LOC135686132 n=1 Tax=Rhopilema esculentum TaxID=499914 RepID=UPI0031CDBA62